MSAEINQLVKIVDEECKKLIKVLGLKPSSDKNVEARKLERRSYCDHDEEDFIESESSNPEVCMRYRNLLISTWIAKARPRDDTVLKNTVLVTSQSSQETDKDRESGVNNGEDAMQTDQVQTEQPLANNTENSGVIKMKVETMKRQNL